ncbi:MAG: DNA internalization-related competence protein ComEC/Rec2 [Candidatus Marinimicrobia bacterium]|nr:DNA internalization-related competence protein ComEC/Rec2 [Candidatus Neomarinimicrobiota bacterium]
MFRHIPLVPVALALMAGMVLGFATHWHWGLWAGGSLAGLALARRWDGALLLAVFSLGGWLAPPYLPESQLPVLDEAQPLLMRVVVQGVDDRRDRTHLTLQVLEGLPDSLGITRLLWRAAPDDASRGAEITPYLPGDTLLLRGQIAWPDDRRNPNGFDYRFYLWGRRVDALLDAPVEVLAAQPAQQFHLGREMTTARRWVTTQLADWLGERKGALAAGLLLGVKGGIDEDFMSQMRTLGIGHILAVSGLHVGYVVLVLLGLTGLIPWGQATRVVGVGIGLLGYTLITGAPPSVVRASIMAILFLWGRALERKPDVWNILAAAAIISLLIHPRSLFTASFQLSFTAVAGILHLYPRLKAALQSTGVGDWIYGHRPARFVVNLFLLGLGAQAGTLPVTLVVFHSFSLYGLVANLVVIPLAGFAVIGSLVALLTLAFSSGLAALFSDAIWLCLSLMQGAVDLLSQLPHPQVVVGRPGMIGILGLVAGVMAFPYLFASGRVRFRIRFVGLALIMANLMVWRWALGSRVLQVTILDVGQGDAIHLALPDGRQLLVDAGGWNPQYDYGERVVIPYLRGQGIGRIDVAVITHPHADHLGGLAFLLRTLPVGEIWDTPNRYASGVYSRLKALADSLAVPIRILGAGEAVQLGEVDIWVLAPDSAWAADAANANDASLVLKIRYGGTTLLLMGDAERKVERRLLAYGEVLRTDWLKVGHHGSATSSTVAFLAASQPQGAVVSVGRRNRYGHPAPEALDRLRQVAGVVHRTDRDGALVLRSDGTHWTVVNWR